MFESLRKISLTLFVVFITSIFVSACSSGGDGIQTNTNAPDNETDEVNGGVVDGGDVDGGDVDGGDVDGGDVDGGDVVIEGPAPTTPLINSSSARALAIETLELADALVFHFSDLNAAVLGNEASGGLCASGGSVDESSGDNSRTFEFDACKLYTDSTVLVTGQLTFTGSFDNGFVGEQAFESFSVVSGNRTVSIVGTADVQMLSGNANITNAQLVVNDSQADAVLKNSAFSVSDRASVTQSVTLDLTLDMPRFGLTDVAITSARLTGETVACPQAGSVVVDAGDNGSISVDGSEGENQSYTVDGVADTLACVEVASIFDANSGIPFIPPPVPD